MDSSWFLIALGTLVGIGIFMALLYAVIKSAVDASLKEHRAALAKSTPKN